VHLDLDHAVALAGLAAPALDVEGEAPRRIAARLGLGQPGEPLADRREGLRVGRRVRPRGAAYRRLVDIDHLVEVFQPVDPFMRAGVLARAVQPAGDRLVERIDQQGRLAAARDAGDAGERAERDLGGDVLEVDRGFAVTTPVPPTPGGPHQYEFVYRLDYGDETLDLGRVMRFGAEEIRVVVPVDVATPTASDLTDLGAADFDGRLLRLLEGGGVAPGETLNLAISGLPMPTIWNRISNSLAPWFLRAVLPGILGVAGLALLVVAMRRRAVFDRSGDAELETQRLQVLERVATLEAEQEAGQLSARDYAARRQVLKSELVRLELQARLRILGPPDAGLPDRPAVEPNAAR
jgi:hypothetical protein